MLNVDLTRAARSHEERLDLVRAIAAAPSEEPETDWIEWKSALDPSRSQGAFALARSILGFGNRDPDFAARYARGCAYLVVGAAPGNITGTDAYDPADIEQWLASYVAKGEPQWSVDFLDVDSQIVMLITIESPQWGDSIFTLQKTYNKAPSGTIFVRGNGRTAPATSGDIRRLADRVKRADLRLNVGVRWRRIPNLLALQDFDEQASAFASREAERLRLPAETRRGLLDIGITLSPETRTRDEYRSEVANYLENAKSRYHYLVEKAAIDAGLATIELELANSTEMNFPRTQVTLRVPSDIGAYFDSDAVDEILQDLKPPTPWGAQYHHLLGVRPYVPGLLQTIRPDGRQIEVDEEVVITLPPVDVRPRTCHQLLPVELVLPPKRAGGAIVIQWRATSTGAVGEVDGVLEVEIASDPVLPALSQEETGDP